MNDKELLKYMDLLLTAAYQKCNNYDDAEDLVQDTLTAALMNIRKNEIEYPKTWLMSILNHKYYDMLRKKYHKPTISYDDMQVEPSYCDLNIEDLCMEEEKLDLWREISFLSKIYREVVIRYYLKGQSISRIAVSLNIPEGTVKSRLNNSRTLIKKGMEAMNHSNKLSYEPDILSVACSGRTGLNGEPCSVTSEDKIAQNLLILAYQTPMKEEELAKAIGIPLPYLEPIIQKLVDNELMKRFDNGKVYTDFIIYTQKDRSLFIDAQKAFVSDYIDALLSPVMTVITKLQETGFYKDMNNRQQIRLIFFTSMMILENAVSQLLRIFNPNMEIIPPDRPNGGKWTAFGYHFISDDLDNRDTSIEKYFYTGLVITTLQGFLQVKEIQLLEFHTFISGNYYKNLPYLMETDDMLKLLSIIEFGKSPEEAGINLHLLENVPTLIKNGVLYRDAEDTLHVDLPVLSSESYRQILSFKESAVKEIVNSVKAPFLRHIQNCRCMIPKHLTGVPLQKQYQCGFQNIVMAAIMKGIELGYSKGYKNYFPIHPSVLIIID